jgi:hypothetical protein
MLFRMLKTMVLRLAVAATVWPMVSFGLVVPTRLVAQDATYFQALSIPPRSVGTCLSAGPHGNSSHVVATEARLVMTSVAPNRRREILVVSDVRGRAIRFADMVVASTGLLSSTGDNVVAVIDAAGQARGFRLRGTVQMPDSAAARLDTASIRAMREHAVRQSSREPLDATAQHEVQKLVDWMRTRCPT